MSRLERMLAGKTSLTKSSKDATGGSRALSIWRVQSGEGPMCRRGKESRGANAVAGSYFGFSVGSLTV